MYMYAPDGPRIFCREFFPFSQLRPFIAQTLGNPSEPHSSSGRRISASRFVDDITWSGCVTYPALRWRGGLTRSISPLPYLFGAQLA